MKSRGPASSRQLPPFTLSWRDSGGSIRFLLLLVLLPVILGTLFTPSSSTCEAITIRLAVQTQQTSAVDIPLLTQLQVNLTAKYGTPVEILVEEQPSDPAAYAQLIRGNYLGTNSFDIYEVSSNWIAEFAQDFVNLNSFEGEYFPDLCSSAGGGTCDYEPNALGIFQLNDTGATVAVPWYVDMGALYYRQSLIDQLVKQKAVRTFLTPPAPPPGFPCWNSSLTTSELHSFSLCYFIS